MKGEKKFQQVHCSFSFQVYGLFCLASAFQFVAIMSNLELVSRNRREASRAMPSRHLPAHLLCLERGFRKKLCGFEGISVKMQNARGAAFPN